MSTNEYLSNGTAHAGGIQHLIEPSAVAGDDIARDGSAVIKEDRLYKLIHDPAYGEHTIEIIIEAPGLRAFTFTFG